MAATLSQTIFPFNLALTALSLHYTYHSLSLVNTPSTVTGQVYDFIISADVNVPLCFVSTEYNSLNNLVSEAFIRFFLETIGHYSLFITQSERGERIFQREAFRKSVASKSIRRFLGVFMESQMFAGFIQDRELRKTRAKGENSFHCFCQSLFLFVFPNTVSLAL